MYLQAEIAYVPSASVKPVLDTANMQQGVNKVGGMTASTYRLRSCGCTVFWHVLPTGSTSSATIISLM